MKYEYEARLVRVIDGDTFELSFDLGFGVSFTEKVRLFGADTPEIFHAKTDAEKAHGMAARAFVADALANRKLIVETHKDRKGKYGRYIAAVKIEGIYLAQLLRDNDLIKRESYE